MLSPPTALTCAHVGPVALHAVAGLILGEHTDVVALSTEHAAQVAVGHGVVAVAAVDAVGRHTLGPVGHGAAGPLPRHRHRVGLVAQAGLHVGRAAGHCQRERDMGEVDELETAPILMGSG